MPLLSFFITFEIVFSFHVCYCDHVNLHAFKSSSLYVMLTLKTSLLYPCSKPCLTETRNEMVKKVTLFSALISRIMMVSRSQISNHGIESRATTSYLASCPNVINCSIESKVQSRFAVTIVIHKSHNLSGSLGSREFGLVLTIVRFFGVII